MTGYDRFDSLFGPVSPADTADTWSAPFPGFTLGRYNGDPCDGCMYGFMADPNCGRADCPIHRGAPLEGADNPYAGWGGKSPYPLGPGQLKSHYASEGANNSVPWGRGFPLGAGAPKSHSDLFDDRVFHAAGVAFNGRGGATHPRGHTAYRGAQAPSGSGGRPAADMFNTSAPVARALRGCGA